MKIFCHVPRENWIVDRMGDEFKKYSSLEISTERIDKDTDLIWLLGSWCWNQINPSILKEKKVLCTIHHEVPWKFDDNRKHNFLQRDMFVDHYLTYTNETKSLINSISNKPVTIIPHWINTKLWKQKEKIECRKKLNLPYEKFIVGSFQRDTEGSDLKTPKLEKGPDIFVEKVVEISKFKDVHVLLGGWRRQYIVHRLEELKIQYTYIELPNLKVLNEMYNALDLYVVSSRCEGGPQALFEASYLKVPLISTKVGQHNIVLSKDCLYEPEEELKADNVLKSSNAIEENYKKVIEFDVLKHINEYDKFITGEFKK